MSQLLGGKETLVINSLTIETDEMIDTQIVDIGIVSSVLTGDHHHSYRPQRSPTVLQHKGHDDDRQRKNCHAVKQSTYRIAQQNIIV